MGVKRYPWESGAFLAAGLAALLLVLRGNTLDHRILLLLHIWMGLAAAVLAVLRFRRQLPFVASAVAIAVLLPVSAAVWNRVLPAPHNRIVNPPSPPLSMMIRRSDMRLSNDVHVNSTQANSGFAVGQEEEQSAPALVGEVGKLSAPIGSASARLEHGSTSRVDVGVRIRKIGRFFPAGTVDAFDGWLELQATEDTGRVLSWSGKVEDDGKGPIEPGAHFYRSLQLDDVGSPIDKRNAWQSRSLLYVRLIPPGAADVAHYLAKMPVNAKGQMHLKAHLNYGQDPALLSEEFNGLEHSFLPSSIQANVSGKIRGCIPDPPIVILAEAHAMLDLGRPDVRSSDVPCSSRPWSRKPMGIMTAHCARLRWRVRNYVAAES
jgi:hypothetical protein